MGRSVLALEFRLAVPQAGFERQSDCGSIDDRRWRSLDAPRRPQAAHQGGFDLGGGRGRQALSRAGAQIPPLQFRGFDRPGRRGPHRFQRVRDRADSAGLDPDRRARGRQDHHGADSRPRAELRTAGRFGEGPDHPHAGARACIARRSWKAGTWTCWKWTPPPIPASTTCARSTTACAMRRPAPATRSTSSTKSTCSRRRRSTPS